MNKRFVNRLRTSLLNENYENIDFELRDFVLLDKSKLWTNNKNISPVQYFIRQNQDKLFNVKNYRSDLRETSLNNTICNLIFSYETQRSLAVKLNKTEYLNSSFYGFSHYTYSYLTHSIDMLDTNGYITVRKGYYDNIFKRGKLTRIIPIEKLLVELRNYCKLSPEYFTTSSDALIKPVSSCFDNCKYIRPIILKNNKKRWIKYDHNMYTKKYEKFLLSYNNFISKCKIQIPTYYSKKNNIYTHSTAYNISSGYSNSNFFPLLSQDDLKYMINEDLDCRLYRVFNNCSFEEGGRFYGAQYQRINEEDRGTILINDNPTIEIDYFSLHGKMIYHLLKKIDYLEDPYIIDDNLELRAAGKKMFQMMLNAKGKITAIRAFKKFLIEDIQGDEIRDALIRHNYSVENLYSALETKHSEIKEYFSTGIGLKLQFIDSTIAEAILKHFQSIDIPCLCIHDSFIVEKKFANELAETMEREYKYRIGFDCKLKIKD